MRFPPQFLDDLRARLPVSEIVGRRVKLRKAGREWKGLSPFNQENTPSFFVNDQKGMWFDFSSGRNGNIFDFVMATDGVSFPEAVERLAGMAGLPLPQVSPEAEARDVRHNTLHDVMELAAKFFETTLASRAGARGRGYLADRGLAPATQLRFRLGYAPAERFALKEHLGAQGVPVKDMVDAGLLIAAEDVPVPYDRFRDRVMFPISDLRGRVIAFGGRALEKDIAAKYLNSPETPLFHKGATLYNGAPARVAAHAGAPVIAVEGYVDVIAMVTAGYEATVAPLGTALTEQQLALLWKMTDEPVLCFDGDSAGRRAAYRAVDLALPQLKPGKSLRFASLPEGQDPDDLVRSGGHEAVREVLAGAKPLADVLWQRETEAGGFDTPERRAALEARLAEVTAAVGEESVRRHYRQEFDARVRRLFSAAAGPQQGRRNATPRFARGAHGGAAFAHRRFAGKSAATEPLGSAGPYVVASPSLAASPVHRSARSAIPRREALILQTILNHPWLLQDHMEELAETEFRHADTQALKAALIDILAHGDTLSRQDIEARLDRRDLGPIRARVERAITTQAVWGARADAAAEDVLLTWNQLLALNRQRHSLLNELKDAERALGQEDSEASYTWLCDVKARLSAIDGTEALIEAFGAASGRPSRNF